MNKFEQNPNREEKSTAEKIQEIALQAAELPLFQKSVKEARGKMEAIRAVRALLAQNFPEISDLPAPQPIEETPGSHRLKNPLGGVLSNEFIIAKQIVDLLWEK